MQVSKNTKRALVFNLIMVIVSHSGATDCYTKAVYTKNGGVEKTNLKNSTEVNRCADNQLCMAATGSFVDPEGRKCLFL